MKPATKTKSPTRMALAQAIASHAAAIQALDDARAAAVKARDNYYAAFRRHDALLEESAQPPDDSIIIDLVAGGDVDAETLQRPAKELRAKIDAAEAEAATWKQARDIAEQAIPVRQKALEWTAFKLDDEVRAVMAAESDIGALVKAAEEAQAATIAARCKLQALLSALPHNGEQHAVVDKFLASPWFLAEGNWSVHPAATPFRIAFAALKQDADAPLPS